jgi:RecB family exonuclease
MPLTLHTGARSSTLDDDLLATWRERGGHLVCRDEGVARQAAAGALVAGPIWDATAGTFAHLFARTRARAGLPEADRRDGLALRCAIAEALDPPGAGHVAPVERLVLELRAHDVAPADFAAAVAGRGAALETAARVFAAVAGIPSPDAPEWETARAAGEVDVGGPVFLVGFDDYPPLEWTLLCALAARNDVHASLAYEPDRTVFAARHERAAAWRAQADAVVEHTGGGDGLEGHLFERAQPVGSRVATTWLEAAGTQLLCRLAVDSTLAALHAGIPAAEIAIVVPRLSELATPLLQALAEGGIEPRCALRLPFAASPLGRGLLNLWAFACEDEDADGPEPLRRLLAWLRTPYSGADQAQVDRFEADMHREGIARRATLMRTWDGIAIAPARALRAGRSRPLRTQAEHLVSIGFERLEASAGGRPPTPAQMRDHAALTTLGGVAASIPDDDPPTLRGDVLPGRLGALLGDLVFTDRRGPAAGVSLLDVGQVRGLRYRHVIVLGLEEGTLPGGPMADPYLDPPLRLAIGLPARPPGTSETLLRFHAACAAATETLVLCRRFADDDGRELAPSPYWNETRRLLGRDPAGHDGRLGGDRVVPRPAEAATLRGRDRGLARDRIAATPAIASALGRRTRGLGLTAGLARDTFRVTELETYHTCNYGWFVGSVIRPQELVPQFDAAAEGTLGHRVLEATFTALAGEACTPAALPRFLAAMHERLDAAAEEQRPAGAGRAYEAFIRRMRIGLTRLLRAEAARGPRFVPHAFELRLRADDLVRGVTVTGTSDRVDVSPDGRHVFVIDYKRSGRAFEQKGVVHLQLPLYGVMAGRMLAAESAGGAYLGVLLAKDDGRMLEGAEAYASARFKRVQIDDWAERLAQAQADAEGAVADISAGVLKDVVCTRPYCGHWMAWR